MLYFNIKDSLHFMRFSWAYLLGLVGLFVASLFELFVEKMLWFIFVIMEMRKRNSDIHRTSETWIQIKLKRMKIDFSEAREKYCILCPRQNKNWGRAQRSTLHWTAIKKRRVLLNKTRWFEKKLVRMQHLKEKLYWSNVSLYCKCLTVLRGK